MQYRSESRRLQFQHGVVCVNTAVCLFSRIECKKCYGRTSLARSPVIQLNAQCRLSGGPNDKCLLFCRSCSLFQPLRPLFLPATQWYFLAEQYHPFLLELYQEFVGPIFTSFTKCTQRNINGSAKHLLERGKRCGCAMWGGICTGFSDHWWYVGQKDMECCCKSNSDIINMGGVGALISYFFIFRPSGCHTYFSFRDPGVGCTYSLLIV